MFAALAVATTAVVVAGSVPATAGGADSPEHGADVASHPHTAIHGVGGGRLTFEGFEGDPVTFRIHGRTSQSDDPLSVRGAFHVTHERRDGSPFAEFAGSLDCLLVGGDVAVATGVIETFDVPGMPGVDLAGKRVGLTVSDDSHGDRIGWSWVLGVEQDAPLCMSTAPFFEIERGGFVVRD